MKKSFIIFTAIACLLAVVGTFFFLGIYKKEKGISPISSVSYVCEQGTTLSVSFFEGNTAPSSKTDAPPIPTGTVEIRIGSTTPFTLSRTLSADGGRYANTDESIVFWDKGNTALFMESGKKDFTGCIKIPTDPGNLVQVYADPNAFAIRFPEGYFFPFRDEEGLYDRISSTTDYQVNIPTSLAKETNLSPDTHFGVEHIQTNGECIASLFLDNSKAETVTEGDVTYSVASTTDAGAGNRYYEIVYAFPGTRPCRAVRYFIHYGVFENYPEGSIKRFDEADLIKQFDEIRKTLILGS